MKIGSFNFLILVFVFSWAFPALAQKTDPCSQYLTGNWFTLGQSAFYDPIIESNGKLYFTKINNGKSNLARLDPKSGKVDIIIDSNLSEMRHSPKNDKILVVSPEQSLLMVVDTKTDQVSRVKIGDGGFSFDFSSSDNYLIAAVKDWAIFTQWNQKGEQFFYHLATGELKSIHMPFESTEIFFIPDTDLVLLTDRNMKSSPRILNLITMDAQTIELPTKGILKEKIQKILALDQDRLAIEIVELIDSEGRVVDPSRSDAGGGGPFLPISTLALFDRKTNTISIDPKLTRKSFDFTYWPVVRAAPVKAFGVDYFSFADTDPVTYVDLVNQKSIERQETNFVRGNIISGTDYLMGGVVNPGEFSPKVYEIIDLKSGKKITYQIPAKEFDAEIVFASFHGANLKNKTARLLVNMSNGKRYTIVVSLETGLELSRGIVEDPLNLGQSVVFLEEVPGVIYRVQNQTANDNFQATTLYYPSGRVEYRLPQLPENAEYAKYRSIFQAPLNGSHDSEVLQWGHRFFESAAYRKYPELTLAALVRILEQSNVLFESIVLNKSDLNQYANADVIANAWKGLKSEQKKYFLNVVKNYHDQLISLNWDQIATQISQWKAFSEYLFPVIQDFEPELKAESSLKIAKSIALAASNSEFEGVLNPKLIKLIHQTTRKWYGVPNRHVTDISLVRKDQKFAPLLLSVDPLGEGEGEGEVANSFQRFGFYAKWLPDISLPETAKPGDVIADVHYQWQTPVESYDAHVTLKMKTSSVADFAPRITTPIYTDFLKDGKFTGLVMTGENLSSDDDWLMDEYISYYRQKGFRFSKKFTAVPDMKSFILDRISNGELDYFVKEAHADGDDRNIFRLINQGSIMTGKKVNAKGQEEVIYVFRPEPEKIRNANSGVLLSNAEFSAAINARSSNAFGQFVFFNTSCSSHVKVQNEVEAVANPIFLDIGANTMLDTFQNSESSAFRAVLDGFLTQKTFSEIRTKLESLSDYKSGFDHYLFPDSEDFNTFIRSQIKIPVEMNVEIKNSKGQSYNIDDAPMNESSR